MSVSSLQLFYDLIMFRKSTRFEFGVNHIAVGDHIEYAATTGDQFCINPKNSLQFVRQTGGSRFVVSFCTVVNFDLHVIPPFNIHSDRTTLISCPSLPVII